MILIHINHPAERWMAPKNRNKWTNGQKAPGVTLGEVSGTVGSGAACDEGILGIREVVATWFGD
jgi:hypothetical protein